MPGRPATAFDLASLQRLLSHLPVPVFVKDGQSRGLFVNQAFEALFGVAPGALHGNRGEAVFPAEQVASFLSSDAQVFAHGDTLAFDAVYWSAAHAGNRLVHSVKTPLFDAAGQPQFLIEVATDITERKQEQAELHASDQRFRDLVDFTDGIVWEADAITFNNSFISKSAERLLGYPLAEWLTPDFWADHIHPDDREHAMQYSQACVARCEDHEFEYRFLTQDGRVLWIHDSTKIALQDGQPRWLRGLMVDISERKRAEQQRLASRVALHESEQRYRTLVEWLPDAVCVHREGIVLYANPAAVRHIGAKNAQDLVGRSILEFFHPDNHAAALERSQPLTADSRISPSSEEKLLRLDGSYIDVEVIRTPILFDGEMATQSVLRDITERNRSQEQLRVSHQSLKAISQGVVIADPQQRILSVNDAFTTITGYRSAEAVGKSWDLLQGPDTALHSVDAMRMNMGYGSHFYSDILHYRKDGSSFWNELTVSPVRDALGRLTHFIGVIRDNTKRHQDEEEIRRLAFYDSLTELPNRRLLMDRLKHAQTTASRTRQHAAVAFLDLDNFKQLNDTLGHDVGDVLLQQVAARLTSCVREGDSVARLGGDEFVVLLEALSIYSAEAATQAEMVASKILQVLGEPYMLGEHSYHSTPSIGIVVFVKEQESIDDLLKKADIAMYQAKAAGRNTARFYEPAMQAAAAAHAQLEKDLRLGLARHEFVLHYQIQVETQADGQMQAIGTEALVRWQHPKRGMVLPAAFISVAEETGLILPLGQWVLETACAQLVAWAQQPDTAQWTVAVNVSAAQFSKANFVSTVRTALHSTGANPALLKLEITESMLMNDVEDVIAKMNAIKAYGVHMALDDFGTGYSSLSYLKRLPLDQLKIDKSFVRDLLTDPSDAVIARTIVALGHSLGLKVVAEGVENIGQHDFLASIGCDAYQGYYFGRPVHSSHLALPKLGQTAPLQI
ncbi:EAL domain-containing protein [Rhodoferax sp.]|uniref:EAL domain-containing protein n=1 Tax=Rhodoferax sp. TaxID=50421 RepID=UPI00374CD2C0